MPDFTRPNSNLGFFVVNEILWLEACRLVKDQALVGAVIIRSMKVGTPKVCCQKCSELERCSVAVFTTGSEATNCTLVTSYSGTKVETNSVIMIPRK